MRRPAVVIGLFLACCTAACSLRRQVAPPSPYCRGGEPLAGVYHPQRLRVKDRCAVAVGTVRKVVFEAYDGDVHIDLRPDPGYERLLSDGNARIGGNLVVELLPQTARASPCPTRARASRSSAPGSRTTSTAGTRSTRPGGSARAGSSRRPPPSCARVQLLLQRVGLGNRGAARRSSAPRQAHGTTPSGDNPAANRTEARNAELADTASALVAEGKGILAADESDGTIKKRFDSIDVESTEDSRRAYRELLFTTEGAEDFISGVILFDETIRQSAADGTPFPKLLERRASSPGSRSTRARSRWRSPTARRSPRASTGCASG